jgi:hypothetical protein
MQSSRKCKDIDGVVDFCSLAPETMEELSNADQCALGKRLSQLAEASQRCGWGGFTCSESGTREFR